MIYHVKDYTYVTIMKTTHKIFCLYLLARFNYILTHSLTCLLAHWLTPSPSHSLIFKSIQKCIQKHTLTPPPSTTWSIQEKHILSLTIMIECGKGLIHATELYLLIGSPGGIRVSPLPPGGPISMYNNCWTD